MLVAPRTATLAVATAALLASVASPAATTAAASAPSLPHPVVVAGYRLYPAPSRLAGQCRLAQRHVDFPVLCPTLMPKTGDGVTSATASPLPPGDGGVAPSTFARWASPTAHGIARWLFVGGIYGGGETDPGDWQANNPNEFFHFFVFEGHLTPTLLDLAHVATPQRFLGTRTIAGRHGPLYTQVSYSLCKGSCSFTGHLTFIWHANGVIYAASLHRWSRDSRNPAVLAVLAALIAHLRAAA